MQGKQWITTGAKVAGALLAVVFLIGISMQCFAGGVTMLQVRTRHEVGEMLLLSPAETVPAAAEEIPLSEIPALELPFPVQEAETPAEEPVPMPEDWMIVLVNRWNPLAEDFTVTLGAVEEGYEMDARVVEPLTRMLADCRAAGLNPMICSAYRTHEYQVGLFEKQVRKQQRLGHVGEAAVAAAAEVVALPDTSEHQTGLAVDLCARSYQRLNEHQQETPEFQWLAAHSAEYGFILRYPVGATEITGIIYEPWHFRYVGEIAAAEIMEAGITLEEYLEQKDRL